MRRYSRVLFSAFLIVVFGIALVQALAMQFRAMIFPMIIIVPSLTLAVIQLLLEGASLSRARLSGPREGDEERTEALEEQRRAWQMLAWAVFALGGVYVVGLGPALGLFVGAYLLVMARRPLPASLVAGAIVFLGEFLVLEQVLHLVVPRGIVIDWLGL